MANVAFKTYETRYVTLANGLVVSKQATVTKKLARNYCNRYSFVLKAHFDAKRRK